MECPATVNIPKLVLEAKAQHVASHGLTLRERWFNRLDLLSTIGSRFSRIANWALGNPSMRWLMEKTFGIAQGRKLPKLARKSFIHWAIKEKLNRSDRSSDERFCFLDQYANCTIPFWEEPWWKS